MSGEFRPIPLSDEFVAQEAAQAAAFAEQTQSRINILKRATVGATLSVLAVTGCSSDGEESAPVAAESTKAVADCPANYVVTNKVHSDGINRPFANGLRGTDGQAANTNAEVRTAMIKGASTDVFTHSYMSEALLNKKVNPNSLSAPIEGKEARCLTPAAQKSVVKMEGALESVKDVDFLLASSTAVNTGLGANGGIVKASNEGISGNRQAVSLTMADGSTKTFLLRCGNLVNPNPGTPEGPTDQPEPTPTKNPEPSKTPEQPKKTVPPKVDDGRLPTAPGAPPRENDPGTPDRPGQGPANQPVDPDGTVGNEVLPTQAPYRPEPARTTDPAPIPSSVETGTQAPSTPEPVRTTAPQATNTQPPAPN